MARKDEPQTTYWTVFVLIVGRYVLIERSIIIIQVLSPKIRILISLILTAGNSSMHAYVSRRYRLVSSYYRVLLSYLARFPPWSTSNGAISRRACVRGREGAIDRCEQKAAARSTLPRATTSAQQAVGLVVGTA
eukprot:6172429-Pleurochrysis_carterae.AAC.2